jgi:hypothetical protein
MGMGRLGEANFICGEAGFSPKALDELRGRDYVYLLSPEPLSVLLFTGSLRICRICVCVLL